MGDFQQFEIWFILEFQNLGEWLTPVMKMFTWMGYPQAYMLIIAIIYWSFDRKTGLRMAIFLSLVSSLNSILKQLFHAPRPYRIDPGIRAIKVSNGFGMPSGHAQAATVWLLAGYYLKKSWFWIVVIVVTFMVGLSRTYLGVHFPSQVIIGWTIGVVLLLIFTRYENMFIAWLSSIRLSYQLILAFGITVMLMIVGGIFVISLNDWHFPAEWLINSSVYLAAENETLRSSIGLQAVSGNAGGFLGTAIGAILLKKSGGFDTGGIWWKRILRCILGVVLIAGIYFAFQYVVPDEKNVIIYNLWRFSAFLVIAFSVIYLIPVLFLRTKLASP